MRRAVALVLAAVVLGSALSGCGRLRQEPPAATPPAAVATPSTDSPAEAAIHDLDAVGDALDQAEYDVATGEQAENTADTP
jgi:predicted small lipoprotein YifL